MAQAPLPGKCVHCLRDPVSRTWDHVFPKAWYPDTAAPDIFRWQVPACHPCNKSYGELEEDLLIRLGLCIDRNVAAASGIVPKVLRALDPRYARNERDRRVRQAKRDKVLRETLRGDKIPPTAVYPGFEEKWGRPASKQTVVTIPAKGLRRLTDKIVRGVFYLEDGKFVEPPYRVTFYAADEQRASVLTPLLDQYGKTYAREPGITVRRAVAVEDQLSSLFSIEIWSTLRMFAVVDAPEPKSALDTDATPASGAAPVS